MRLICRIAEEERRNSKWLYLQCRRNGIRTVLVSAGVGKPAWGVAPKDAAALRQLCRSRPRRNRGKFARQVEAPAFNSVVYLDVRR